MIKINFQEWYDETPLWSAPFAMTMLDVIKYKKGMKVLDVGTGTGFPLLTIAQTFGKSKHGECWGLDPVKGLLDLAERKRKFFGISNAKFVQGRCEDMDKLFKPNFFDLIVSNNGINCADDMQTSLQMISKCLKQNGQFIFTMNASGTMKIFYDCFINVVKNLIDGTKFTSFMEIMNTHIYGKRPKKETVKKWLKGNNFKCKVIEKEFDMKFIDYEAMVNVYMIKNYFMPAWKKVLSKSGLGELEEKIFKEIKKKMNEFEIIVLKIPYYCFDCKLQSQ